MTLIFTLRRKVILVSSGLLVHVDQLVQTGIGNGDIAMQDIKKILFVGF